MKPVKDFPQEGCYHLETLTDTDPNAKKLLQHLIYTGRVCGQTMQGKIIAWNHTSYWFCVESSSKTPYKMSDLFEFEVNDKVKIIQRKKSNVTGVEEGWDKPNGNVGVVSLIEEVRPHNYIVADGYSGKRKYYGMFDFDDLQHVDEPVTSKSSEIIKEEEFVLPEKWCIKVNEDCTPSEVYEWRGINWSTPGYVNNSKYWSHEIPNNYTEITLEQFKTHVLKQSSLNTNEFPKKWCVKITPENSETLNAWRKKQKNFRNLVRDFKGWLLSDEHDGTYMSWCNKGVPDGYKEITYEEFKTHVLTKVYSEKERFIVDKWYKLKTHGYYGKFKSFDSTNCFVASEYFGLNGNDVNSLKYTFCYYPLEDWVEATQEELDKFLPNNHPDKSKKESLNDLLKEAPKRFPIGTVFNNNNLGFNCRNVKVTGTSFYIDRDQIMIDSISSDREGSFTVYKDGKWAEIIKSDLSDTIPEYVECIIQQPQFGNYGELGKIYKVKNWNYSNTDCLLEGTTSGSTAKRRFKPSTKEAYEAQNAKSYVEEWSKGTYAVGVKGNFGVFSGDENPIKFGEIYTITNNYDDNSIAVKDSQYWAWKKNFKWFATKEEAKAYSKTILQTEKTPLEICREKYKKGMLVRITPGNLTRQFEITEDPENFRDISISVDYPGSPSFLYFNGKYAEIIIENPSYIAQELKGVETYQQQPVLKKETLIEDVHSIDLKIRTKKNINKLKF